MMIRIRTAGAGVMGFAILLMTAGGLSAAEELDARASPARTVASMRLVISVTSASRC
mgnify:CR=1 FL=1